MTAADLKELGLIERIIPEEEPANTDTLYRIAGYMDRSMVKFMKKYQDMSGEELASTDTKDLGECKSGIKALKIGRSGTAKTSDPAWSWA